MKVIFSLIILLGFLLVGCHPVYRVSHSGGGVLCDTITFRYNDTNEKLIIYK